MRTLLPLLCCLLLMACSSRVNGEKMSGDENFEAAWQAVRTAASADGQRQGIDAFLTMNQQAGAPALQVSVKRLDTGKETPVERALWEHPQQYEVTLHYGDRKYSFVPQSRASLEPLFRE